jgi:hypothetical protein
VCGEIVREHGRERRPRLAAAFAGWLGGRVISDEPGLRWIYLVGALLTVAGRPSRSSAAFLKGRM